MASAQRRKSQLQAERQLSTARSEDEPGSTNDRIAYRMGSQNAGTSWRQSHADEISDLWRAYGKCQEIHNRKCKSNCPPPKGDPLTEVGIGALMLGGAGCIAFPEICIPGLVLGGAAAGVSQ